MNKHALEPTQAARDAWFLKLYAENMRHGTEGKICTPFEISQIIDGIADRLMQKDESNAQLLCYFFGRLFSAESRVSK